MLEYSYVDEIIPNKMVPKLPMNCGIANRKETIGVASMELEEVTADATQDLLFKGATKETDTSRRKAFGLADSQCSHAARKSSVPIIPSAGVRCKDVKSRRYSSVPAAPRGTASDRFGGRAMGWTAQLEREAKARPAKSAGPERHVHCAATDSPSVVFCFLPSLRLSLQVGVATCDILVLIMTTDL